MLTINKRNFLKAVGMGGAALLAGAKIGVAEERKYRIGLAMNATGHPFNIAMMDGNKQYAAEHFPNVEILVTDGQAQTLKQVQDVESLIARGVDAIMISPNADQPLHPVLKAAMAKNIPVITLDSAVSLPVTSKIGANNRLIGAEVGKFVTEKLGKDARIIEIQGTSGRLPTIERGQGFSDGLGGVGKIIAQQYCDYARAPAVRFMEDMTNRFAEGEFNVVYAHNDTMALGAIQVLRERGRLKDVVVVGIDGENAAFKAVAAGEMAGCWIYPACAPDGIKAAYAIVTGAGFEPEIVLPTVAVTKANVQDYLGKGI
ncbi:MAG: substrate-binding domain-containing protein [Candidatus Kaistia colombiensis]|nr:MAG: substrate-binding domain-containing protein [Kaistia sp.]